MRRGIHSGSIAVTVTVVLAATVASAGVVGAVPASAAGGTASTPASASGTHAAVQSSCSFPVGVTDATGTQVVLREEPERIVTVGPSAAQTLWEIEAKEKVVGVSQYADYLDGAESRANVSTARSGPSVEKVIAQNPDLVIVPNATNNGVPEKIQQIRAAGIPTYVAGFGTNLAFIRDKTKLYGRLVGECDAGDDRAAEMGETIQDVRQAVADRDRPRTLYVFFGFTAGDNTYIHEVIETAGGENLGAEINTTRRYYEPSDEAVIQTDPEFIVLNSDDFDGKPPQRAAYNATTAVQEGNVVVVNADYISQAAPRIVQPLETLAAAFHPDAYPPSQSTPDPDPAGGGGGGGDSDDSDTSDDSDDDDRSGSSSDRSTSTPSPSPTPTTTVTEPSTPTTTATAQPTSTTPTGTSTASPTPTSTPTPTPVADGGAAGATTDSEGTTPGFGVVVALVALVALAGLTVRRRG